MDLYELRELFVDDSQLVKIYDADADSDAKIIFEGEFAELPEEMETFEVCSIDTIYKDYFDGYVGINVSTE